MIKRRISGMMPRIRPITGASESSMNSMGMGEKLSELKSPILVEKFSEAFVQCLICVHSLILGNGLCCKDLSVGIGFCEMPDFDAMEINAI
jgi:hypothetical protein